MKTIRSLLIIDDNAMDVLLTRKMLEKSGRYQHIMSATDGAEAMKLFRNYEQSQKQNPEAFPPLVILLDINMPLMDGFEFLQHYSELDSGLRDETSVVVMLTSSSYQADRQRALGYPMVKDYVVKPMNRERAVQLAESLGS